MRTAAFIAIGWLGVTFWTALGSRLAIGHVLPELGVITAAFLAFRRDPVPLTCSALVLGYLTGRAALAPVGLHEVSLAVLAVVIYSVAGNLVGSGALFFAATCGVGALGYHALLFLLGYAFGDGSGFSSWWTAALIPGAFATFGVAWLSYPVLMRLEQRMAQQKREGLTWS